MKKKPIPARGARCTKSSRPSRTKRPKPRKVSAKPIDDPEDDDLDEENDPDEHDNEDVEDDDHDDDGGEDLGDEDDDADVEDKEDGEDEDRVPKKAQRGRPQPDAEISDEDALDEDGQDADEDEDGVETGDAKPKMMTDADRFPDYLRRLKARRRNAQDRGLTGAATGLAQLDAATGGVQEVTILGGPTQSGKTSLAAQICLAALQHDPTLAVVYWLLDQMTEDDLFDQLICHRARVDHRTFVDGKLSPEEQGRVESAVDWLRKCIWPRMLTLDSPLPDKHGFGLSSERMFNKCRGFMEQVGARRLLVVIDMLDDMPIPWVVGTETDEYVREVHRIEAEPDRWRLQQVLALNDMAKETSLGGWPILAICKLRKSLSRREEPSLDDLLGSVQLAYKAARVLFLIPEDSRAATADVVRVTLVCKKGRHARPIRLPLDFHHTQFRFAEAKGSPRVSSGGKSASGRATREEQERHTRRAARLDPLAGMD